MRQNNDPRSAAIITNQDRMGAAENENIDEGMRAFFMGVYAMMGLAMATTAVVGGVFGADLAAFMRGDETTFIPVSVLWATFISPLRWAILFAPLALVFMFSPTRVMRLGKGAATATLMVFAALIGLSTATMLARVAPDAAVGAFLSTSVGFLAMSFYGYTTRRSLGGLGGFLIMGLFALIAASIINIFMASSALSFGVSLAGVVIFAGLTAWDTQRLKNEYVALASLSGSERDQSLMAASVLGALSLFLNFLNMFMSLLSLGSGEE